MIRPSLWKHSPRTPEVVTPVLSAYCITHLSVEPRFPRMIA